MFETCSQAIFESLFLFFLRQKSFTKKLVKWQKLGKWPPIFFQNRVQNWKLIAWEHIGTPNCNWFEFLHVLALKWVWLFGWTPPDSSLFLLFVVKSRQLSAKSKSAPNSNLVAQTEIILFETLISMYDQRFWPKIGDVLMIFGNENTLRKKSIFFHKLTCKKRWF